jgi:hypothetical protein
VLVQQAGGSDKVLLKRPLPPITSKVPILFFQSVPQPADCLCFPVVIVGHRKGSQGRMELAGLRLAPDAFGSLHGSLACRMPTICFVAYRAALLKVPLWLSWRWLWSSCQVFFSCCRAVVVVERDYAPNNIDGSNSERIRFCRCEPAEP